MGLDVTEPKCHQLKLLSAFISYVKPVPPMKEGNCRAQEGSLILKNFFIVCVHVCIHMYAHGDQRLTLGVFLDCPPSYILGGDLSLNPELADSSACS